MRHPFVLACFCTVLQLAQAADTPSNMASPAPAVAADPLASPRSAVKAGDWPRAIRELQDALGRDPGNADIHNLLGYSYRKQARPDLARAFFHYHEALRINPAHRAAREYLGEAYVQAGQVEKAREQLEALERLCGGRLCEEYRDLEAVLKGAPAAPKRW